MSAIPPQRFSVDKVRASRDGHEYHETWTARKAMQLLWPDSTLFAIAIEGPSPSDQKSASPETIDIADITLYYGHHHAFERASRTTIAQLKYSVADQNTDFRASHARKTISKFAVTFQDYKKRYGAQAVRNKLDFELITNRPIFAPLRDAINALASGLPCKDEIKKQADQFKAASGLVGKPLAEFAEKCKIIGLSGSLPDKGNELAGLLIDWSATNDPIAAARLGALKQMVRNKAGFAGTNQNLIKRADVLAILQIGDPNDLLPCQSALANVGQLVEREQVADAIARIQHLSEPMLIHAAGGVGKTVFMTSLAAAIKEHSEVVFFDCFGGGAYRSPEDARHLPQKGLIHIVNTLAFQGMCDPILPNSTDVETLLKTFRRRLNQCVSTLKAVAPGRGLVLFIDAIDNAELFARERNEMPFPILILESLHHKPIPGVKLIVSSRTERKPSTHAKYQDFELLPFNIAETAAYLRSRLRKISDAEINVAQARSGGNPRVLEYLVKSGKGMLDASEIENEVELDVLIQQRISEAMEATVERGHPQEIIDAFLAGLAVLPPPVPINEYANALGLEISAIESFAADLRPLLERTSQGLMFRDEPTETLIRNQYASSKEALERVSTNLLQRQDVSVYAARALPNLLHLLDDGEKLFELAFDDRFPKSITSTVGKRNIRYARLKAATLHAAINSDHNRLVRLLLELSTIAAVDQKGADYILDNPDLVVAAKDADATRRLFEIRTNWPGARHARLAIANTLSGEFEEAYRHAIATDEWLDHYRRTDDDERVRDVRPGRSDIAAIPFFLIAKGKADNAAQFLKGWQDWYAYEVCEYVFNYSQLAQSVREQPRHRLNRFINILTDIGPLTAALSFLEFQNPKKKELVSKLSKRCKKTNLQLPEPFHHDRTYGLEDGLRKASAIALSLGLRNEALVISLRARHPRPGTWDFRDVPYDNRVFESMFRVALVAAAKVQPLHEKDVLPKELIPICARISRKLTGQEFRNKAKKRLSNYIRKHHEEKGTEITKHMLSFEEGQRAKEFLDQYQEPLLKLTKAFSCVLAAPTLSINKTFIEMIKVWEEIRESDSRYHTGRDNRHFFHMLGLNTAIFTIWARSELKPNTIKRFLKSIQHKSIGTHTIIQVVAILASREPLHALAGEQAIKARSLIETEDDVVHRASLFSQLSRAMLPASIDEASTYFRDGLEQMDAIGSGDYQFTNELLLFASTLKGDELDGPDLHTLTNICELNMGEEPEKFPWGAFARAMSNVSGPIGLAKLSRWDDRSKISLNYTLLPYLTALVADGKIDPELAVALNYLADPVEYHEDGTKEFSKVLQSSVGLTKPDVISEFIRQYLANNPGVSSSRTLHVLTSLAKQTLGPSPEGAYLAAAETHFDKVITTKNHHMNYHGEQSPHALKDFDKQKRNERKAFEEIVTVSDPLDQQSLAKSAAAFKQLHAAYELKKEFFDSLRKKVPFRNRATYIKNVFAIEDFNFHWQLEELSNCRAKWGTSSSAIQRIYTDEAIPLLRRHVDDLIWYDRLSGHYLSDISDLTGVPISELAVELAKVFTQEYEHVSGSVWLALASFICAEAKDGQGQLALQRLLQSDASRLADNVVDGTWADELYPKNDIENITANLIWRVLGSPNAESRWRAAHSIRCLVKFGRWKIIDILVGKLSDKEAGSFQAKELTFFYLHARLWLLITLARMAVDHPKEIARYKDDLLSVVTEETLPHVLIRHFAARALTICIEEKCLKMDAKGEHQLRSVDLSPYPPEDRKGLARRDSYGGRPEGTPEPESTFNLEYDFRKEVDGLGRIFGKSYWELEDLMSEITHQINPGVSNMYDSGGRESPSSQYTRGITLRHHTLGQQLGWHALFMTAGKLLSTTPTTKDEWGDSDQWKEWLGWHLLSREDEFWLSDGRDRIPLDTAVILQETIKDGLAITGDQEALLRLIGITSHVGKELVVNGSWDSSDGIHVRISSALVPSKKAAKLARKLVREDPMQVWLPTYTEAEFLRGAMTEYKPWIVCPEGDARLDQNDPFGTIRVNHIPRLAADYISTLFLSPDDRFGKVWKTKRGAVALRGQAWGREDNHSEDKTCSGVRLSCSSSTLRQLLKKTGDDLLILLVLQKYEKGYSGESGKFSHTVAVVRIADDLKFDYFKGKINHLHVSRF